MTIEQAIQSYLQEQRANGRKAKTMEWHQTALCFFQQYLQGERHLSVLTEITSHEVRGWMASLQATPSAKGTPRSAGTIAAYARSVRAFCHWLVRQGYLEQSPVMTWTISESEKKPPALVDEEIFGRLLLACQAGRDKGMSAEQAATRNRAILWVLWDTGMRVSELCDLRLLDVDREQRALKLRRGEKERRLPLSPDGWAHLLQVGEQVSSMRTLEEGGPLQEEALFLSEGERALECHAVTQLFGRLRKRAGLTQTAVSPSVVRDTVALRLLQAGVTLEALREVFAVKDGATLRRYEQLRRQWSEREMPKISPKEPGYEPALVRTVSRRRRRRGS